ncbi:MAG: type II toxin-antitoxin system Phd/YefM family antitoxin [Sinobacteraceae bacterium]|nr:type II toxin-antitoxin system Phd/YefM family antitoxin [Nevskiaceae bacterium]
MACVGACFRGYWLLQDATVRFGELVRNVRSEGPQHVTVNGRDAVVVVSAEEFRRLEGNVSGEVLIAAMQISPSRGPTSSGWFR